MSQSDLQSTQKNPAASPVDPLPSDGRFVPPEDQDPSCICCQYNLRGLRAEGACPECATPLRISLSIEPFVSPPQQKGTVDQEVRCTRCGAGLLGSATDDRCSSCDAPVWFSIHGVWLRTCDPQWLAKVRSGLTLWLWSIVAFVLIITIASVWGAVASFMAGASAAAGGSTAGTPNVTGHIELETWISGPLGLVSVVLFAFASFRVTAPNPAFLPLGDNPSLRRIARASAIAVVAMQAVSVAIGSWQTSWGMYAFGVLLSTCIIVAEVCLLFYLQSFARMIPNRSLVRSATIVIWGYTTASVVQIVVTLAGGFVFEDSNSGAAAVVSPGMGAFASMACVVGAALLIFFIWKVRLITRTRREVARALDQVIRETQEVTAE